MEDYQGSERYEPSADELIDVLKSLENLAATNSALYRAIVDQIKVHQPKIRSYDEHHHHHHHQDENGQELVELEAEGGVPENGHYYEGDEVEKEDEGYSHHGLDEPDLEPEDQDSYDHQDEVTGPEPEPLLRMPEAEVDHPLEPAKTVIVMAGAKNRSAWPIAPGAANGSVPKPIEITAGSLENEEEVLNNRIEIAQAAGLKHVDDSFYPQPLKDYDYPWAGSLRPVSNKMLRRDFMARRGSGDHGTAPWVGSLRHVDEKKVRKPRTKQGDDDDYSEVYGNAPWMGTLRHVKHESRAAAALKPQFKRYPDEDAPNPYSATQGRLAKPCYPLTPAAIVSRSGGSKRERELLKQEEEVERIRSNLRETRTVSSALLKALMPKLLKEHESKYEPLGHDESIRIMEEILSMQIGLNTAQPLEDNDEAEQMIRAIEQGEIDKSVYSKMADDLEVAAQIKRKETAVDKKKKKKKKKPQQQQQQQPFQGAISSC